MYEVNNGANWSVLVLKIHSKNLAHFNCNRVNGTYFMIKYGQQNRNKGESMDNQEVNVELVMLLNEWDPFKIGEGNYDTEIADCVYAVHKIDNVEELAVKIQEIYEFSFEETIPMENCVSISAKLLLTKESGSCAL